MKTTNRLRPPKPTGKERSVDSVRDADASLTGSPRLSEAPHVHLTRREREVLALLCEGLPNKAIARRLRIAVGTVKVHVANIFRALHVTSRLEAVVRAHCWDLVQPPLDHHNHVDARRARHR